ncbi:MAG: sel1 repeat family protein [Clostridia bacterium]|nr:sel1 repeat family protein [Clostridia bacterium]
MEEMDVAILTQAAKTDPIAQYNLGVYYQSGAGGTADLKRAVKWWEKSAEAGYAPAQYNLGVAYEKGIGVKKNGEKALSYYEEAAKQRFAPAEYNLGVCYLNGEIVQKDPRRALFYYNAAASHGHKEALNAVGRLLGEIVK